MPLPLTIHEALTPVNYTPGRGGHRVTAVCLHITDGDTAAGAIGWFHSPASQVSAHYVIDRAGSITRVVDERDTAWANGVINQPNMANPLVAGWVTNGVNPNSETVSIECVGKPSQGWTTKQLAVVDLLNRDIANRWGIPVNATTIIGHRDLDSVNRARCPSLTPAQWEKLRQSAALTDDQKLEIVYQRNAAAYGAKRYAGDLTTPWYTGRVLRTDYALLTPDGRDLAQTNSGNILDDVEQAWEASGVLIRY